MKTFRPYEPDQMLLLPPSLSDWVPEDHLARFVGDLVDTMDLSAIEDAYDEERGHPPYNPRMMVKVLLYGYSTGTYSSRKLAARITDHVPMRFLAAGNEPDFRTISDFRKRHEKALSGLFDQVLQIAAEAVSARHDLDRDALVFSYHDDHAADVRLAGDFNQWDMSRDRFTRDSDGLWIARLGTPGPGCYRYKLVVDGRWIDDPGHLLKCPDPYGGFNSLLWVADHPSGDSITRGTDD